MKKTCNDCKALDPALTGYGYRCSLGYKITAIINGEFSKYSPSEECPKPKTIKELINFKVIH